jgi:phage terminase small subunit
MPIPSATAQVPDLEEASLGPAMLACNPAQRRFALAAVMFPLAKDYQIARAAGYSDFSHGALRVTAHRLFHDERVLAAIRECADKEVRSGAMLGIATIKKIVRNDAHRDQFKAAALLAGLNRFTVDQNINVNQTVTDRTSEAILERIKQLAAKLGVDPAKLLGSPSAPVDAEFSEVKDGHSD